MKEKILILGAGQHGRVVANLLKTSKNTKNKFTVFGFLDDNPKLQNTKVFGIPVVGKISELEEIKKKSKIKYGIMGISNRFLESRGKYFEKLIKAKYKSVNVIHDTSIIDINAKLGIGNVINPNCVINAFATIGDNCVIYTSSVIEHEDIIGNNVFIGPGVLFTADVHVGNNSFIGVGSRIIPHVTIGENVTIGAGSVVLKDVGDNETIAGIPAKPIK